jgi:ketosteroid isomerase-like protein
MTIARVGLVLLIGLGAGTVSFVPCAAAQQPVAPGAAGDEAEHEALRQLKALYEAAIRDNKVEALGPYFSSDIHGVMVTGRVVTSVGELKQYWTDIHALIGEGGSYTTTLNPERSVIVGDVALARGSSDDVVVTSDKQEFRFTSFWTAVLQKQEGRWKLLQVQGTIDPVDNPFVREFRRRSLQLAIPISALGGLVIGLGVAWFMRKRAVRAT